jgi:hypothetical protein
VPDLNRHISYIRSSKHPEENPPRGNTTFSRRTPMTTGDVRYVSSPGHRASSWFSSGPPSTCRNSTWIRPWLLPSKP